MKESNPHLPKGSPRIANWSALRLNGPLRALVLSDTHIPYHDTQSVLLAVDSGRKFSADVIVLNGDACDFHRLSNFVRDPRLRRPSEEIKMLQEYLAWMRGRFRKARILFKLGNHEERFETYMLQNAPDLIGIDQFDYPEILRLKNHGMELVRDKRPIRIGELNVIHGHEYRFQISNPVNPARGLFLKAKAHAMCAHFHQTSHHSEKDIEEGGIATWSVGCLCDLHPPYMPLNNWGHGFALVEVSSDGKFNVMNRVIRKGKVY